jgi:hypothetical protein
VINPMKNSRSSFATALTLFLFITLPLASIAAPRHTGVEGQTIVYISYGTGSEIAPGVWVAPPSVAYPVAASFTVLSNPNGREVARVTTDRSGNYALSLRPGTYTLVPDPVTLWRDCTAEMEPFEFTVRAREFRLMNVFYFRQGACPIRADP